MGVDLVAPNPLVTAGGLLRIHSSNCKLVNMSKLKSIYSVF